MKWIVWLLGAWFGLLLIGVNSNIGAWLMGALVAWLLFQQYRVTEELRARIERLEQARQLSVETEVPDSAAFVAQQQAETPTAAVEELRPVDIPQAEKTTVSSTTPETERLIAFRSKSDDLGVDVDESSPFVTTSMGQSALAWLKGGNAIVRVAVLLLFFGVAFLLRYATEHSMLPIELRLGVTVFVGFALATVGWRLREKRRGYGISLQGAGVGIAYLSLYVAFRLYQIVPASITFVMLALLSGVCALLAVRQNAMPLALLGFGGGFLAPVLSSTGEGSHVTLFAYYLVLNLGISWIAHRQTWKPLNAMAFLMTFGIGSFWGVRSYTPENFWTAELFLLVHFLLFLFISVQYTRQLVMRESTPGLNFPTVDAGLLFGVPVAAFGLQAAMLQEQPLALSASAAVLSGIYLLLGRWLWRMSGERILLMVEGMMALGLIFLLLVAPLAMDAQWTGVVWAVQGAGVVWIGIRQERWWAVGFGLIMQLAASVSFWSISGSAYRMADSGVALTPFINSIFVSALVLVFSALSSALTIARHSPAFECEEGSPSWSFGWRLAHMCMLVWGLLQLVFGTWPELRAAVAPAYQPAAMALMWVGMAVLCWIVAVRLRWTALQGAARVLLALATVTTILWSIDVIWSPARAWTYYVELGNSLVVITIILFGLLLLRRIPTQVWSAELLLLVWAALWHGAAFAYSLGVWGGARHDGWPSTAAMALPTALALGLLHLARIGAWPATSIHQPDFIRFLHVPWLGLLAVWVLGVNLLDDGSMSPLPYLPLLNPTDLMHGFVVLYALRVDRAIGPNVMRSEALLVAGLLGFVWLNGVLIRSLHQWLSTPMWMEGALNNDTVQTGLTILWTVCAFVMMVMATRFLQRRLWIAGAVLLALVVCKLFLVDLSQVGTLTRIMSFLGVGGLMLIIGYLAPLPPNPANEPVRQGT